MVCGEIQMAIFFIRKVLPQLRQVVLLKMLLFQTFICLSQVVLWKSQKEQWQVILFIGSGDSKSLVVFLTEVPSAIGEVVV